MDNIKEKTIYAPSAIDLELAMHGFVLYKETPTPIPDIMPCAKLCTYRRNQGDVIEVKDSSIEIVFSTHDEYSETVTIDTQQGYMQFSTGLWLSFDETQAFVSKARELSAENIG